MSTESYRLLVTSAGRRVGLIDCFRRAAQKMGLDIAISACDMNPEISAACQHADSRFAVPACSDAGYVETLLDYCRTNRIAALVPTIDTELQVLAQRREDFAAVGTYVHVSSPEVIALVRDKNACSDIIERAGVPVPRTALLEEVREDLASWNWPLFLKPVAGSASRGIEMLRSPADLRDAYPEPMLVQHYLQGPEYTVSAYIDGSDALLSVVPHLRIGVRAGEVEKGRTEYNAAFEEITRKLVSALPGLRGAICFQLIDDARLGPCVFEINARFGGGYPLADHAGARYAESVILESLGKPACADHNWRTGTLMLRYDAAIYR